MLRRTFIGASAAAITWRNRQSGMAYRRLGRTNFMISEITFGTLPLKPSAYEHVQLAIDMGLNYIDTAAAYGNGQSEEAVGKAIAGQRERVFLNTKVSLWTRNRDQLFANIFESLPESEQKKLLAEAREDLERRQALDPEYFGDYFKGQDKNLHSSTLSNVMERRFGDKIDRKKNYRELIVTSVEESLRRLKTDYLDLLTCPHGASSEEEVLRFPETFDAFEALRKAGKVRYLSVSAHSDPAGVLKGAIQAKVYSAAMIAYSIVNHRFVDKVLEEAARADLGVIAMKAARPVYPGRSYQVTVDPKRIERLEAAVPGALKTPLKAYVWVLRNPGIAAVNSEMLTAQIVKENLSLAGKKL